MEVVCLNDCGNDGAVSRKLQGSPELSSAAVLSKGSMWAVIWHMSWPLTVNMVALALMNLFEGWIGGRLGAGAQAAMGIGGQLWFLFMMMTLALAAGTTAIVSRYCGAGDFESAVVAGRQAILCSLVFSAIATIFGLLACRAFLRAVGATGAVEQQGIAYLNACLFSMVPYTVLWISNSIFRASGDAFTPMASMMLVFALIVLSELVLCLGPVKLGLSGVGISWTMCSSLGIALNYFRLKRSSLSGICDLRAVFREGISLRWSKRFLAIGIPSCVQDLAIIGGSLGIFLVLSKTQQPLVAQAAWAAGWRLEETLTLMPVYGLNLAAAAIVGQNLGARLPARAASCGWLVTALGCGLNIVIALVMLLGAPFITSFLCADATVSSSCVQYLHVVCWTEPFFACWRILSGAMQGAGYTRQPMVVTVFSFLVLRIALAAALSSLFQGEPFWTWVSMAASTVVAGLLMVYQWHLRRWQAQQV